ncbi:MAG: SPOR domain-containing protein [Bacteroidota bacterium]
MKVSVPFFSLFFILLTAFVGNAQEVPEFTVQVGNFVNPKPADFEQIASMGFLYAVQRADSHTDVYLGGFTSDEAANKVVSQLKSRGYSNAFVSQLNTENGQSETVIQLDTKTAGDKIDWEQYLKAGKIYVLLNGKKIKILSGGYASIDAAKANLSNIKKLGFDDAFVKNVNNVLLHEVGTFEAGGIAKKPLIPLDFSEKENVLAKENTKKDVPTSFEDVSIIVPKTETTGKEAPEKPVLTAKGTDKAKPKTVINKEPAFDFRAKMPDIRAKVKRTSALELQKVLKAEGYYKSSLDGYYGNGTRASYDLAARNDHQLQKYRILARYMEIPATNAQTGALQGSINSLWQDPQSALGTLEVSKAPIAKVYRAYFQFTTEGPSYEVNTLMNEALKEAGSTDVRATLPTFDPYATYDYRDIKQLLTHMRFVHETTREDVTVPCWLFRRHPGTALKAFGEISGIKSSLSMQTCGGFWEWQEVQLLNAIASDLCTSGHTSEGKIATSQNELAQLYLAPESMGWKERKALMDWDESVWKGINGWATRDPLLDEIATALKISYFQTYVLLEDYYMDEGFDAKDSKGLALATLKALVGHHFERFI